ncbi:MAG TPA: DUF305 domain-containing protein [Gammaproteobacteria bacterium]
MKSPYGKLAVAICINAVAMYFIMYAMIRSLDHFHFNINSVYMTVMMVAPMVIVMLVIMRSMFHDRKLNYILHAVFAAIFLVTFWLVRTQSPVGDEQFLRSMIPHHSGAILMCRESAITDPEIMKLCDQIIRSQKEEIARMQKMLESY